MTNAEEEVNRLRGAARPPGAGRSRPPVIKRKGKETIPNLTARRQNELEQKEDLATPSIF